MRVPHRHKTFHDDCGVCIESMAGRAANRAAAKQKLTPPDPKQCQAEKPNGHSFMTLGGGRPRRERCTNKPTVIATERRAGKDGQKGSMSLCDSCKEVMLRQVSGDTVTFRPVLVERRISIFLEISATTDEVMKKGLALLKRDIQTVVYDKWNGDFGDLNIYPREPLIEHGWPEDA